MKKRLLAMLLCLALIGSMLPVGVVAQGTEPDPIIETTAPQEETVAQEELTAPVQEETAPALQAACEHEALGWTKWDGTGTVPTSGNIILTGSVQLTGEWLVDGTVLSVCLNGNHITAASGSRIFRLINGGKLDIYDCKNTGKLTGANVAVTGAAVQVEKNSTFSFHGGNISGNRSSKDGCGVYAAGSGATFNMYGGTISNNTTTAGGGGVCAGSDSVVNITGGSITSNQAANGGGMIIQGKNAKVLLQDCSITGNTGTTNAGGVYVGYNTASTVNVLTFSGNVKVTGNVGGSGKIAANVQFMSAPRVAYVKDLGANAQIGVRKNNGTEIITSGASTAIMENFISDSPTKVFQYMEGKLYLIDKPAESVPHANTEGYTACNHPNQTWAAWYGTDSLPTDGGSYYLSGDVVLADTWKVADGQTITICLNGCDITPLASGKRLIHVTKGTVNICDCTAKTENGVYTAGKITGANTAERGAGVALETNGVFNLYDGCIEGNTSSSYGGGVYVHTATFNMYGGSVAKNHADTQSGGGICTNGNATVNVTGGSVTGNTAKNGGGVIAMGANDKVLLKDCAITGNSATNLGGGVYVGKPNSVTLSGKLNITGNTKGTAASNLFVCSTKDEERAVIQKDLDAASTIGIGIYLTTKSSVLVKSGATEATVKCYISDDTTKIVKYEDGKLVLAEKPAPVPNHANTEGYTACGHGEVTWTDWYETDSLPTVSGTYYLMDDVYLTDTWKVAEGQTITICLNGFDIVQNAAKRVIHVTKGTVNICDCTAKTENGVYTAGKITGANTAERGAGVALETNGVFNLYDGCIEGNTSSSYGGGVYVHTATFNMYGGSVAKNHADTQSGGGICTNGNATVNVTGGSITGNTAKNGGGVIAMGANDKVLLKDCAITGNSATNLGGGVYVGKPNSVTLSGKLNITGNIKGTAASNLFVCSTKDEERAVIQKDLDAASTIGIGIYNTSKSNVLVKSGATEATLSCYTSDDSTKKVKYENGKLLLVEKPLFTPNHADTEGYEACGHGTVTWTDWYKTNSLPTESGHYYLVEDVELTKAWNAGEDKEITICLNGHSITQTTAGQRVIRVGASTLNICDCTAHTDEQGVYIAGKITGGNTDDSTATGSAGAMMLTNGGTFRLYDGMITGNHTGGNGALVVQKGFVFEMHGGAITGNTAGKQGGAVYLSASTMTVTGGEISGNEAVGSGGAIYNNGGELMVSGGVIAKNTAGGGGGGICFKNGTDKDGKVIQAVLNISGGEVSGNISKLDGSGVRMDSGIFEMTGGQITDNGAEIKDPPEKDENGKEIPIPAGGLRLAGGEATISGGIISGNRGGNAAGILATCDLTMTGGEVSGNIGTGNGAGVYVSGATFYFKDGKITNNRSGGKGAGVFLAQATLEMTGGEISENTAAGMGGGIGSLGGTINLKKGTVKDNYANGGGGGIYYENRIDKESGALIAQAVLNISGGEVSGNISKLDGNGVRMDSGIFEMTGGKITDNGAEIKDPPEKDENGKELSLPAGGLRLAGGEATISGGIISGNRGGNAAGVLATCDLTMTGGEVSGNIGTGNGAGVYTSGATFYFKGGKITKNQSGGKGAGVFLAQATLEMTGGEISDNTAAGMGGGVATLGGIVRMADGLIGGNVSNGGGGGIYTQNRFDEHGNLVAETVLELSGGKIYGNSSRLMGGGIRMDDGKLTISGGEIAENKTKANAGGVCAQKATVTIKGGKILKNRAEKICGGLLAAQNSRVTFSGGTISGNTAKGSSGGVMIQSGSHLKMTGGTVSNNIAVNYGGGIYVDRKATAAISGGSITGNAARKSGGGVYVGVESRMTMTGGKITGNDAKAQGGGMVVAGTTTISGGTIFKNTAKKEGAGVYVTNATLTFTGGTVEKNITEYNGGGICVRGETGILKISDDAKVLNNECKESGGGILVQGKGYLEMDGGEVIGNVAPNGGGGIRLHNCPAEIKNAKINGNTSNGQGAGIYSNLSLILKDSEVCNNKIVANPDIKIVRTSAAIRTYNESTLEMENVKVTGNTCDGRAGAMEVAYNVDAYVKNCTFKNNTATERGGTFSIYREGQLYMYDCTVEGGSTDGDGGAFYLDAYGEIYLTGCTVTGNQGNMGGVAYVGTKGVAKLSGCTVKDNVAKSHASVIWANGSVTLEDTVITGNKDKKGGAAVYLDNDGQDNESYIPGVYEIIGNTSVCNNDGGDMVLVNNAFLNIHGDGLGVDSRIQVKLQDDDITRWIVGPYSYEANDKGFLLTKGEQSLSEAFMGQAQSVADEQTQEGEAQEQKQINLPLAIIGGSGLAVVLALAIVVAVVLGKKKKK